MNFEPRQDDCFNGTQERQSHRCVLSSGIGLARDSGVYLHCVLSKDGTSTHDVTSLARVCLKARCSTIFSVLRTSASLLLISLACLTHISVTQHILAGYNSKANGQISL